MNYIASIFDKIIIIFDLDGYGCEHGADVTNEGKGNENPIDTHQEKIGNGLNDL